MPSTQRELQVWLQSEVPAFCFEPGDFEPLGLAIVHHATRAELLASLEHAALVTTWYFEPDWYARAPALRAVFTPAAGRDWVAPDPAARVPTHYGSFHGPLVAESLLAMMLHFNRRIPALLENQRLRGWDRTLQTGARLLRGQRVLLVGYGNIARECARVLGALGATVIGLRRRAPAGIDEATGALVVGPDALHDELARSDHIVLLLPGGAGTRGFLDRRCFESMKPGGFVYNFGRGTSIDEAELLRAIDGGVVAAAGLDVTALEPLPASSPLWTHHQVFVTPHSSCVYDDYRSLHVAELGEQITPYLD